MKSIFRTEKYKRYSRRVARRALKSRRRRRAKLKALRRKGIQDTRGSAKTQKTKTVPKEVPITQIKDPRVALKDLERFAKDPRFLRVGRELLNFKLRPREVFANWLLCAVGNYQNGRDSLTFAEDPTGGDGVILNRKTGQFMLTEHVFIPEPKPGDTETVEDKIVAAVQHKVNKGSEYARGKHLVVFSEAIGWWFPNRAARRLMGTHGFSSIWTVALQRGDQNGYIYSVAQLDLSSGNAPSWRVSINFDFTDWKVDRVQ